jgi:hypothetical protein
LAVFALKSEASKMSHDQIAAIKKNVYVLPKADRVTKWRELAGQTAEFELQQEALIQLGWEGDKSAVPLAIGALSQVDPRIRGVAAQGLAYFGPPMEIRQKDPLQRRDRADDSDRPQITWALVTLHDARVFDKAMELYRLGHLAKVQRLGGGPAFDPEQIAKLVSLDHLAGMAGDQNESVRQLIANILSRNAVPKFTDPPIKLVRDPVIDVAREARDWARKIADAKARAPCSTPSPRPTRTTGRSFSKRCVTASAAKRLVIALNSVSRDKAETTWHQNKQLFDMLRKIADPRASTALTQYLGTKPFIHWETEAALRLAEVGDLRAVPYLASRMRLDPLKIYSTPTTTSACRSATTTPAWCRRACWPTWPSSTPKRSPRSVRRPKTRSSSGSTTSPSRTRTVCGSLPQSGRPRTSRRCASGRIRRGSSQGGAATAASARV